MLFFRQKNAFVLGLSLLVLVPLFAYAAPMTGDLDAEGLEKTSLQTRLNTISKDAGYEIDNNKTSIETIVGQAIQALLSLLGTIFLGLVVYGGFVWMQAKGDENEIKRAQGMIKNGIIGMAIIIFAYAIAYFVIFRLQFATMLANPPAQTP